MNFDFREKTKLEKEGSLSAKWDSVTSEVLPWGAISSRMELIFSQKNLKRKKLEGKYQIKKTLIIVIGKIRNLLLRENAK